MPTSDEILLSMQLSLEQDESIDVRKGPFFDLLRPVAGEIAPPYEEIQRVSTLYSSLADGTVNTIPAVDLKTIGRNLRVSEPVGRKASTLVYFYCTTIPADTITIPAGTPVMTEDRALIYTTTGSVQVKPSNIQQYYNSKNSRYEIPVTVVAASEGTIYSIPAYRITRLGSNIAGISGVYNPSRVVGGEDAGDAETYLNRIRTRFLGKVDSATFGITSEVQTQYGDVLLSYVQGDSKDFKRQVRGKGLDVVVPEEVTEYQEDLFVATGSNEYTLTKSPVIAVESVQVDGVVANFEFIPDETRAYVGSAKGQYKVRVSASTGSSIRVRYQYCYLCDFLQTRILNAKATGYFGLDCLARLSDSKRMYVTVKLTASSATSGLLSSIQSEIMSYVSENGFGVLSPQDLRSQVMQSHPELRVFNVVKFSTGAEEAKVLQSNGYENYQLGVSDLNITFTN